MSRVLVIGGTGLAGRAVTAEAVERGHQVVVAARRVPDDDSDRFVLGATYVTADIVTGDGLPDLIGTPSGGVLSVWPGNGSGFGPAVPVKGSVPSPAGLPSDLSGYDWVLEVQPMRLKGKADYIVRDRASGATYVYGGRKKGVSAPRLLGEGLGAFDLAG